MEATTIARPLGEDFDFEIATRHRKLFQDEGYEWLSTAVFKRAARRSDVIIDIGAHVGWYSAQAGRVNRAATIIAVEGSPGTSDVLRRNLSFLGPRARIHNAVFGSERGRASFQITEGGDHCGTTGPANSLTASELEMPMISGGDLRVDSGHRLLIKVDVEGHELAALHGLRSLLDDAVAASLLVGFGPSCLANAGFEPKDVLSWLWGNGFKVFALDDRAGTWRVVPTGTDAGDIVEPQGHVNLFCVRGVESLGVALLVSDDLVEASANEIVALVNELIAEGHLVRTFGPQEPLLRMLGQAGISEADARLPWWGGAGSNAVLDEWGGLGPELRAIVEALQPDVVFTPLGAVNSPDAAADFGQPVLLLNLSEFLDTVAASGQDGLEPILLEQRLSPLTRGIRGRWADLGDSNPDPQQTTGGPADRASLWARYLELPTFVGALEKLQGAVDPVRAVVTGVIGVGDPVEELLEWGHRGGFAIFVVDEAAGMWCSAASAMCDQRFKPGSIVTLLMARGVPLRGVVTFLHSGGLGGAERAHLELSLGLAGAGHLMHTLLPTAEGGLADMLKSKGLTFDVVSSDWWVGSDWDRAAAGVLDAVEVVSRIDPDLLFTQTGVIPQGALAADLLGIPHVWFVHEFIDLDHNIDIPIPARGLGEFISLYSDRIVVNTPTVGLHVLPEGTPFEVLAPLSPPPEEPVFGWPDLSRRPLRLIVVGTVCYGKGQDIAVQAVYCLCLRGFNVTLELVGGGSPADLLRVRTQVSALGLEDRVSFIDPRVDMTQTYRSADVVVVASRSEAFGRVAVEAVAHGRPVVYSRSGGMNDYMIDGKSGVGFNPGDADSLADAIMELATNEALREVLRVQALPAVRAWIAEHEAQPGVLRLLSELLAGPGEHVFARRARRRLLLSALATIRSRVQAADARQFDSEAARIQASLQAQEERQQREESERQLSESLTARNLAAHERDTAISERDTAISERDTAISERDTAIAAEVAAHRELHQARRGLAAARVENTRLSGVLAQTQAAADSLIVDAQGLRDELAGVRASRSLRAAAAVRRPIRRVKDRLRTSVDSAPAVTSVPPELLTSSPGVAQCEEVRAWNSFKLSSDSEAGTHPLFDPDWYLRANPDVAASGQDPREHYCSHGSTEGRSPHPLFDVPWYLAGNPDVAEVGVDAVDHYLAVGWREGRDPHPLFDSDWYLQENPDVVAAGLNPLLHFTMDGIREGRSPHPLFDLSWYLQVNPDVAEAGVDPVVHYLQVGGWEGRDPHPLFDSDWYLQFNPDVAEAGLNPLLHFLTAGVTEGRDPNPYFDVSWYLLVNPDVAQAGIDPIVHYLQVGGSEGRDPHPLFDSDWYLQVNPDVAEAGLSPLYHFLAVGAAENRAPNPSGLLQPGPGSSQQRSTPRPAIELLDAQYPALRPLPVYTVAGKGRVNLVTDSIAPDSLYGGVGTAIILACLWAEQVGRAVRVVTRRAVPEPSGFAQILRRHGIELSHNPQFLYRPQQGDDPLEISDRDVFLTTSWWTTWATRMAVGPSRIAYLLQEDERMFYPAGDESLRAWEMMNDKDLFTIINTEGLSDYLTATGCVGDPARRTYFEPSFAAYQRSARIAAGGLSSKRQFFFYSRPHNPRNLYFRGVEAIERAIEDGSLDPEQWDITFVGRHNPSLVLAGSVVPHLRESLGWEEYADLLAGVDLGLSLMATPHPSYPPLDLAASGGLVVTNRWPGKPDLDRYSSRIISADPTPSALAEAISVGVSRVTASQTAAETAENKPFDVTWQQTLSPVIDRLIAEFPNV